MTDVATASKPGSFNFKRLARRMAAKLNGEACQRVINVLQNGSDEWTGKLREFEKDREKYSAEIAVCNDEIATRDRQVHALRLLQAKIMERQKIIEKLTKALEQSSGPAQRALKAGLRFYRWRHALRLLWGSWRWRHPVRSWRSVRRQPLAEGLVADLQEEFVADVTNGKERWWVFPGTSAAGKACDEYLANLKATLEELSKFLEEYRREFCGLALAVCLEMRWPLPFECVFQQEFEAVDRLRKARNVGPLEPHPGAPLQAAKGAKFAGLALSGGGIRSATFNLGVLQALAARNVLRRIDYLSTVSGGGYIGSWLAAWLRRTPFPAVEAQLNPDWGRHAEQEAAPQVEFLRDYSNYLTPRLGLLSADTWAAVAIFFRNLLLNLTIFVSLFIGLLMVPYVLVLRPVQQNARWDTIAPTLALILGIFLAVLGSISFCMRLRRVWDEAANGDTQGTILMRIVAPFLASVWGLTTWLSTHPPLWSPSAWLTAHLHLWGPTAWLSAHLPFLSRPAHFVLNWGLAFLVLVDLLFWVAWGVWRRTHPQDEGRAVRANDGIESFAMHPQEEGRAPLYWGLAWYCMVSVTANWWVLGKVFSHWNNSDGMDFRVTTWAVPLALLVVLLAAGLQVGLTGMFFANYVREWTARLGGWILIFALAWVALFAIAFHGPLLGLWVSAWVSGTVTLAWVVHTISGVFSAYSARSGKGSQSNWLDLVAKTAAPVFLAGLFILLSIGICRLTPGTISKGPRSAPVTLRAAWAAHSSQGSITLTANGAKPEPFGAIAKRYWHSMSQKITSRRVFFLAALVAFALGFFLSMRVDVNDFSMHLFYHNRLARCYLGASRPDQFGADRCRRRPNAFTGFDPRDDLLLASLIHDPVGGSNEGNKCEGVAYAGPYPILNATLNLTHGERLAWQERKGESFTFTPLYCGGTQNDKDAYRPTGQYAYPGGPFLGTAFSISGAAISPYLGFQSSSAAGFLLTLFNARLSQWLPNPSQKRWREPGPRLGLMYLIREFFGLMNDTSKFVCLSDGGHFENLGIYELVRRRCRYIIACDAGADPGLTFEDLGKAIRKCRSDFGAEIHINVDTIRGDPATKISTAHHAFGTITYADGSPGALLYIKSSLTTRDPTDVREYHDENKAFPHTSTANQWFSESQFESYRQLGFSAATTALEDPQARHQLRDVICTTQA